MMEQKCHKIDEFEKVLTKIKNPVLDERYHILNDRYSKIKQTISDETPAEIKDLTDSIMQNMFRLAGAIKLYNNQLGDSPVTPENLGYIMYDIEEDLNKIDKIIKGKTM